MKSLKGLAKMIGVGALGLAGIISSGGCSEPRLLHSNPNDSGLLIYGECRWKYAPDQSRPNISGRPLREETQEELDNSELSALGKFVYSFCNCPGQEHSDDGPYFVCSPYFSQPGTVNFCLENPRGEIVYQQDFPIEPGKQRRILGGSNFGKSWLGRHPCATLAERGGSGRYKATATFRSRDKKFSETQEFDIKEDVLHELFGHMLWNAYRGAMGIDRTLHGY